MTIPRCALCNWSLDQDHLFNINCAVANATNDQIDAEVEEIRARVLSPEETAELERCVAQSMDVIRDLIAFKVFERMVSRQP